MIFNVEKNKYKMDFTHAGKWTTIIIYNKGYI